MTPYLLWLLLLSLEVFILGVRAQEPQVTIRPDCQSKCGSVTIPFPFGIGKGCYLSDIYQSDYFAINCSSLSGGHNSKPFLMIDNSIPLEVLDISDRGTLRVNHPVFHNCKKGQESIYAAANLEGTTFFFSQDANMFTGLGCKNMVSMSDGDPNITTRYIFAGCFSLCDVDAERKEKKDDNSKTKDNNGRRKDKKDDYAKRNDSHSNCTGINCCQTKIASFLQSFSVTMSLYNSGNNGQSTSIRELKNCRYAFLVEKNWTYDPSVMISASKHVPVVLDWGIDTLKFYELPKDVQANCNNRTVYSSKSSAVYRIFNCACGDGYEGNPYLKDGCKDIDECQKNPPICGPRMSCVNTIGNFYCISDPHKGYIEAVIIAGVGTSFAGLFLSAVAWWTYITIKRRKVIKRKEEFFKRNGGLLLEKQLISSGDKVDRCKLFRSNELDKATDDFNKNRILGQGGQGTVYKGMLADGKIIAVKKSKVIDEVKLEEFVNEVDILSQINHRNVVKLLGCCLETEVPLLVYEFIPNGTLYTYIHNPNKEIEFTWDMRLRIATEVAEALSYLHSAASIPIYHRDIKSTNILLDEMLRAKVADFGTSKSFAMDQTHVTTKVLGTVGYIDPEYFQSNQFTEKSDVYSFGVVLVELLTGENPMRQGKCESLVSYFSDSMKEDRLNDILDAQVQSSGKKEEIMTIASLAHRCLNLNGKKRPTMKEVVMVLEKTRASQKGSKLDEDHCEEIECVKSEITESRDMFTSSTSSSFAIVGPSTDDQPLMTS